MDEITIFFCSSVYKWTILNGQQQMGKQPWHVRQEMVNNLNDQNYQFSRKACRSLTEIFKNDIKRASYFLKSELVTPRTVFP